MRRSVGQAEKLAEKLRALPEREKSQQKISKQDEIRMLSSAIQELIHERHWTIQEIADYLTSEGLEIGMPTLKNYLYRSKSPPKRTKGKRMKKRSSNKSETSEKPASGTPEKPSQLQPESRQPASEAFLGIPKRDREEI